MRENDILVIGEFCLLVRNSYFGLKLDWNAAGRTVGPFLAPGLQATHMENVLITALELHKRLVAVPAKIFEAYNARDGLSIGQIVEVARIVRAAGEYFVHVNLNVLLIRVVCFGCALRDENHKLRNPTEHRKDQGHEAKSHHDSNQVVQCAAAMLVIRTGEFL